MAGAIIAAGITLGTFQMPSNWGWRIPSLLQVIPSGLQLSFIYFLPESPRWLVSKGRGEEAMAILVKYHAEGDVNSEFVKAEYVEIETTLELEKEASRVGWTDLIKTPGMRRRVLIGAFLGLATQWSGNGLTSYALFFFDKRNNTDRELLDISLHVSWIISVFTAIVPRTMSILRVHVGVSSMPPPWL